MCTDVDTVSCGVCAERVTVDLNIDKAPGKQREDNVEDLENQDPQESASEEDEDDLAIQVQEALVKRYQEMITTSHAASCSWRKRGCDLSIQRIEGLLTTSTAISSMRARYQSIVDKIEDYPEVVDLPAYDALPAPQIKDYTELDLTPFLPDVLKLAVCGWQYKDDDVVECKHCFRSLGLWLYRGENPTVEHLDAVESHLEYCPWRSAGAQDTELMIHQDGAEHGGKKLRLPGWALVHHAIKKQSLRKHRRDGQYPIRASLTDDDGSVREQLSPEQREKKMKDLMRRIKEIKKPFNVKSLLRKKINRIDRDA